VPPRTGVCVYATAGAASNPADKAASRPTLRENTPIISSLTRVVDRHRSLGGENSAVAGGRLLELHCALSGDVVDAC
jgi:hypothetical protein